MSDMWALWVLWVAVPLAVGLFAAGHKWGSERACGFGPARAELIGEAVSAIVIGTVAAAMAGVLVLGGVALAGDLVGLWEAI